MILGDGRRVHTLWVAAGFAGGVPTRGGRLLVHPVGTEDAGGVGGFV